MGSPLKSLSQCQGKLKQPTSTQDMIGKCAETKREGAVLLLYKMLVHLLLDSSAQLCFHCLKKEVQQLGQVQRRMNTASKGVVQLSIRGDQEGYNPLGRRLSGI